jgi:cysteinyl-tRNA synthetase
MRAGARVEVGEYKQDDMDFALWKGQKPGEPSWDSPWGPGRPGWHIECSAMALEYLGETIDIHGGGQDLVFPHHENEIAQSETYNDGAEMSRFWVHNGLMTMGSDKMSKSLGNLVTVGEALEKYSSDALRLFFLSSHYRSPLTYGEDSIVAQERAAERLRNAVAVSGGDDADSLSPDDITAKFIDAMDDDLNTPRAIAALFDLAREINRAAEDGHDVSGAQAKLRELAGVLGLTLEAPANAGDFGPLHSLIALTYGSLQSEGHAELAEKIAAGVAAAGFDVTQPEVGEGSDPSPLLDVLIDARAGLRRAKRFADADGVRDSLADLGYVLEDKPEGTRWRRKTS